MVQAPPDPSDQSIDKAGMEARWMVYDNVIFIGGEAGT